MPQSVHKSPPQYPNHAGDSVLFSLKPSVPAGSGAWEEPLASLLDMQELSLAPIPE